MTGKLILFLTGIALLAIFTATFLHTSLLQNAVPVHSFEECQKSPKSITEESYPAVCVTADGKRVTQPTIDPSATPTEVVGPNSPIVSTPAAGSVVTSP